VISGFCVHYPHREKQPDALSFCVRRILRIGLPALATLLLSRLLGIALTTMLTGLFWSLICEAIYYFLYPMLRLVAQKIGWRRLIATAYALSVGLCVALPNARLYVDPGVFLTWILGLPVFLLGCDLAERVAILSAPSIAKLWGWRLIVWGAGGVCVYLRWWSPWHVGYPLVLNVFALITVPWLATEIAHGQQALFFESLGKLSYSLYLMHLFATGTLATLNIAIDDLIFARLATLLTALLLAAGFYFLIECPSQRLASRLGGKLKAWRENSRSARLN
jgi:peptidoglycan/LPS O-acetylase OafA/YrhL